MQQSNVREYSTRTELNIHAIVDSINFSGYLKYDRINDTAAMITSNYSLILPLQGKTERAECCNLNYYSSLSSGLLCSENFYSLKHILPSS